MTKSFADRIVREIEQAAGLYQRLLLVAAPAGAGKTAALQEVRERTGAPLVNANLELSRRMPELTARLRVLRLPDILREIAGDAGSGIVLFDAGLQQNPLRLFQELSRNKTVAAAWNAAAADGFLRGGGRRASGRLRGRARGGSWRCGALRRRGGRSAVAFVFGACGSGGAVGAMRPGA